MLCNYVFYLSRLFRCVPFLAVCIFPLCRSCPHICVRWSEYIEHSSVCHLPELLANILCVCFVKKGLLILHTVRDNLSTAVCIIRYAASVMNNISGVLICYNVFTERVGSSVD
jgi:hypothetical protein